METFSLVDLFKYSIMFGSMGIGLGALYLFWVIFMPPLSILPFRQVDEKDVKEVMDEKYPKRWFFIPTSEWKKIGFFKALEIKKNVSLVSKTQPFFLDSSLNEERGVYFVMNSEVDALKLKDIIISDINSVSINRIWQKV